MPDDKKQEMSNVQFVNDAWKASDDVWKGRRGSFDESWALFWNRYDFSKKATWQSKNFVPKMNRMVRTAAYAFKSALLAMADFFTVEGVGKESRNRAWVVAKLLKYWLDKNDFTNKAVDSMFASLMSSLMVFKVYWETEVSEHITEPGSLSDGAQKLQAALIEQEGPKGVLPNPPKSEKKVYGCLRIEALDPNRVRIDPSGRKKYVIYEYTMDLHDLRELAKVPANKYDKEVVDQIAEDFKRTDGEDTRTKMRAGEKLTSQSARSWRKEVVIREYWGELFDTEGNLIGRNKTMSVADEKYEIRKPMDNPYFKDRLPILWGAPMRVPFSNLHQSFAENINGLCRIATEIFNLTMDSNLWASIKAFEVDLDQVADPAEFKNGVYPGKVFKKRNRGVPRQMLTPLEMGMVNPQNIQFLGVVEREAENGTGVNEFAAGFAGSRKTELATEIKVKGAESKGYLNSIAQEIEETVFDKVLEWAWELVKNFQDDFTDGKLRELLGEDVSDLLVILSDDGRREYLDGKYEFRFRGMSSYLEKSQELDKVRLVADFFKSVPGAMEQLKEGARPLLRKLFESINWNPEQFVSENPTAPPQGAPGATLPQPGGPGSAQAMLASMLTRGGAVAIPPEGGPRQ